MRSYWLLVVAVRRAGVIAVPGKLDWGQRVEGIFVSDPVPNAPSEVFFEGENATAQALFLLEQMGAEALCKPETEEEEGSKA